MPHAKQYFAAVCPAFLLALLLLPGGCGYYFPQVYDGPAKAVYMPDWRNRTNRLALDNQLYQSLSRWFQKSAAITLTKNKEQADLILSGEFISIDLPTVAWENVSSASGTKINLYVRYMLKDSKTGKILWEVTSKLYSEDYEARTAGPYTDGAALEKIISDLSEDIYIGTLKQIRKQHQQ